MKYHENITSKLLVILFIVNILAETHVAVAENSQELWIKENSSYTYKIEQLNEEKLYNQTFFSISEGTFELNSYLDLYKGRKCKITIEYIHEAEDYYHLETEIIHYKNNPNIESIESFNEIRVPKKVEDFNFDFGIGFFSPHYSLDIDIFILTKSEKLLGDWKQFNINDNITIQGTTINYDITPIIQISLEYNDRGILKSKTIKNEEEIIYKETLQLNLDLITFPSIIIFICVILVIVGLVYVLINRIKKEGG